MKTIFENKAIIPKKRGKYLKMVEPPSDSCGLMRGMKKNDKLLSVPSFSIPFTRK